MADNRVAKGIVLVPCLLLGGAFLATAIWGQGAAADNRALAASIGVALLLAGLGAQWLSNESGQTDPDRSEKTP
ncbi:MAG: hypothetical protein CMO00_02810 [Synechococcus sp. SAT82]|nr:hypothetical protein [Synechococcus sp. SAT82]